MDREEILGKLNRLVQQITGDGGVILSRGMLFGDIADWDSLKHLLLIMEVQTEFGVKFEMAEFGDVVGTDQLIEAVAKKLT